MGLIWQRFLAWLNRWAQYPVTVPQEPIKHVPLPPIPPPPKTLREKIHQNALMWIGRDASPKNLAPKELSCAESVANILHEVLPTFPKDIVSTIELQSILDKHSNFERTLIPKPGCVLVSPRIGDRPGHSGFFTTGNGIISNDSKTGRMQLNYDLNSWIREMKEKRGLRIFIWNPL